MFFRFVTKHACDGRTDRQTDGQTDRQNYDPQDRASIDASCGRNELSPVFVAENLSAAYTYMYMDLCHLISNTNAMSSSYANIILMKRTVFV